MTYLSVTADERLVDRGHTFIFFNLFEYNLMNNTYTLYTVLIHFHMRSLSTKVINNYSCVHYIMAPFSVHLSQSN